MQGTDYSAILLGFLVTFIVPLISQSHFSSRVRQIIAIVLAIGAGFLNVAISGQWDAANLVASVMLSIVASQSFYQSLNKTGVFGAIENITDINKRES